MDPADRGSVRGAGIVEWLKWLGERSGDETALVVLRKLPRGLADCFDETKPFLGIDPQKWYPAESFHAFLEAAVKPLDGPTLERYVDDAARQTMNGLMRAGVRSFAAALGSTERYPRVVNALFRLMHDSGRVQITARPQKHESTISDWRGHHPLVCRFTVMCQLPIYERMGCREVSIRHACVANGATACGCVVTW